MLEHFYSSPKTISKWLHLNIISSIAIKSAAAAVAAAAVAAITIIIIKTIIITQELHSTKWEQQLKDQIDIFFLFWL